MQSNYNSGVEIPFPTDTHPSLRHSLNSQQNPMLSSMEYSPFKNLDCIHDKSLPNEDSPTHSIIDHHLQDADWQAHQHNYSNIFQNFDDLQGKILALSTMANKVMNNEEEEEPHVTHPDLLTSAHLFNSQALSRSKVLEQPIVSNYSSLGAPQPNQSLILTNVMNDMQHDMDSARQLQQNQKQDIQKMLTEQYVPKGVHESVLSSQTSLQRKHDLVLAYFESHLPHLDPEQLDPGVPSYSQAQLQNRLDSQKQESEAVTHSALSEKQALIEQQVQQLALKQKEIEELEEEQERSHRHIQELAQTIGSEQNNILDNEKEWQKQHGILREEVDRLSAQNQRLHVEKEPGPVMNHSFINQSLEKTFLLQPMGVSNHMSTQTQGQTEGYESRGVIQLPQVSQLQSRLHKSLAHSLVFIS